MSVDPLMEKYPAWSPYNYCLDNTLRFIDAEGKWPEAVHNKILEEAFKDRLSESQINVLKLASRVVDSDQKPSASYKHAMTGPDQNPSEAKSQMDSFIEEKVGIFAACEGDAGFEALGEALHPVMDETSPTHEGFQVWKGVKKDPVGAVKHALGELESDLSPEILARAVENVRKVYSEASKKKEALAKAKKKIEEGNEQLNDSRTTD